LKLLYKQHKRQHTLPLKPWFYAQNIVLSPKQK
jgi:hypothetical protein